MADLAIERSLLCSVETPEQLQRLLRDGVKAEHFSELGDVYQFIVEYYEEDLEIPPVDLLTEEFPDHAWQSSGGTFKYWYKRFRDSHVYREVAGLLQDNSQLLRDDPQKALRRLTDGFNKLHNVGGVSAGLSYTDKDALDRLDAYRRKVINRKRRMMVDGIPTGLSSIDDAGIGWRPGDLVGLVAFSGVGKSWLLTYFAATAWRFNRRVLFISPEMTESEVEMRADVVLAAMDNVELSHTALQQGLPIDVEAYTKLLNRMKGRDDWRTRDITETMSLDVGTIRHWILEHEPELVCIDGLGFLLTGSASAGGDKIWEQVRDVSYSLKGLAGATNTVIILTNQATRDARPDKIPRTDQIAFGQGFVHACDRVIQLARNRNNENQLVWRMEKNRGGRAIFTDRYLNWEVDNGRIWEIPASTEA